MSKRTKPALSIVEPTNNDFPSDSAQYVIAQRRWGNEVFLFRQADGSDTDTKVQAEHLVGKTAAHEKLLELAVTHEDLEFCLALA